MPQRTRSKPSRRVGVKGGGPIPRGTGKTQVKKLYTPDESVHTSSGAKKKSPTKRNLRANRPKTGVKRRKVLGRKRIRPAGVRRR